MFGIRNRIVKFALCSAAEESKVLEKAIRMEFKDILSQDFGPLLLQIKDEEWGVFVDLVDAAVPDRNTIKVLQAEPIVSQKPQMMGEVNKVVNKISCVG